MKTMNVEVTVNLPNWEEEILEEKDVDSLDDLLDDIKLRFPDVESVVLVFSL